MRLTPLLIIVSLVISAGLSFIPSQVEADPASTILVYPSGGLYYAKVISTGVIITSNADFKTVLTAAFGALTPARTSSEKILLQGSFTINGGPVEDLPSYTIIELDGTIQGTAGEMLFYSDGRTTPVTDVEITGGVWVGTIDTDPSIYFRNCSNVIVSGCEIYTVGGSGRGGIAVNDCQSVLITNNYLHDGTAAVISVAESCSDVEVSHNIISDTAYQGIYVFCSDDGILASQTDIWIHNNTITRAYKVGITIYVDGPEDSNNGTLIENNILYDCANYSAGAMIAGHGGLQDPGEPDPCGPVNDSIIRYNNLWTTSTTCGIGISIGGIRWSVYGNQMYGGGSLQPMMSLIRVSDSDIYDNSIRASAGDYGIQLAGAPGDALPGNRIYNNTVLGTAGILLTNHATYGTSSNNIVSGNIIEPLEDCYCIDISSGCNNNEITNNTYFCPSLTHPTGISDLGTDTIDNDNVLLLLNGINDQTVFYIQFYWLLNGYSQYEYSNHLFDSITGEYNTDTTTHLSSDNYTHFWWQYFYLLQSMGLNCVRLGAFDDAPTDMILHAYYYHKASWDAVWDPMVEMAALNNISIIFCFTGSNAGGTDRLNSSTSDYAQYKTWYEDVMDEYSDQPAIIMWDLYNEPYSTYNQAHYWTANGGYSTYMTWRDGVSINALEHSGRHLIDMDSHASWGQSNWNAAFVDHFDVCDWHGYWSADDTYLISDRANWSSDLGRPWIMGECAINAPVVPPYWWYWDWMNDTAHAWGVSTIWMTLYALPGYPVLPANFTAIPPVPYPTAPVIPDPPAPPPSPIFIISSITSNRTSAYVNGSIQFYVTITGGEPDPSIIWTFDDGAFSMAEDPTHNWCSAGTYHVSLLVNGTAAPNILTITVLPISSTAPPTPTPSPSLGDSLSILGYLLPGVVILVVLSLLVGAFRP